MRKKAIIVLVFIALFCSCSIRKEVEDANKSYLSLITTPEEILLTKSAFEPLSSVWNGNPPVYESFDGLNQEITTELLTELKSRLGDMATPLSGCADYTSYDLFLCQKDPEAYGENTSYKVVTIRFLEKDGVFSSKVYFETLYNAVWYEFDNAEEFVETYWNLAEPSE
ncbi:MAG: hypothetical protein E7449_06555 [Ruminococcaceae bacterium]|nr:hypothetical protein [Oscillospiraceae bacterium]